MEESAAYTMGSAPANQEEFQTHFQNLPPELTKNCKCGYKCKGKKGNGETIEASEWKRFANGDQRFEAHEIGKQMLDHVK